MLFQFQSTAVAGTPAVTSALGKNNTTWALHRFESKWCQQLKEGPPEIKQLPPQGEREAAGNLPAKQEITLDELTQCSAILSSSRGPC